MMYFRLSPTNITLLRKGAAFLILASIGTGAKFSPPLVIIISASSIIIVATLHTLYNTFDSTSDGQKAILYDRINVSISYCTCSSIHLIYSSNISTVHPSLVINGFPCLLILVNITHHHRTTTETYLSTTYSNHVHYLC